MSAVEYFQQANPFGPPGDLGTYYISKQSISLTPLVNDAGGNTDKLQTNSGVLTLNIPSSDFAFLLQGYWRFITPVAKTRNSTQRLADPFGIYADWMGYEMSFTKRITDRLKLEFAADYNMLRDWGYEYLHIGIHKRINSPVYVDFYGDLIEDFFWGGGGKLTYAIALADSIALQFAAGYDESRIMNSAFGQWNMVILFSEGFRLGFEANYIRMIESEYYGDLIKDYRFELGGALQMFEYIRVAVKRTSVYLKEDDTAQWHLDALNIHIPF